MTVRYSAFDREANSSFDAMLKIISTRPFRPHWSSWAAYRAADIVDHNIRPLVSRLREAPTVIWRDLYRVRASVDFDWWGALWISLW